ncbi:hypothetical protein [Streptomyces sp. CB02366]|nr:hypothetical protein [Streptomyces sp. CB02366]
MAFFGPFCALAAVLALLGLAFVATDDVPPVTGTVALVLTLAALAAALLH